MSEEQKPEKQEGQEKKDETSELLGNAPASSPVAPKGGLTIPGNLKRAPGTESIKGEDTTFPRYRLLQGTSSEVEAGDEKSGVFKNSLTEEVFDSKEIIPTKSPHATSFI